MAILRACRFSLGAALVASTGCSLALDTTALQKATSSGGSGGTTAHDASVREEATPEATDATPLDVAGDGPSCAQPDQEPCNRCLATNCCPSSNGCSHDERCNVALVALQQCRRDARTSDNPRIATTGCSASFAQNGGAPATVLLTCMMMSCQAICAG